MDRDEGAKGAGGGQQELEDICFKLFLSFIRAIGWVK
jgi:hypothetical protein